MEKSDQKQMTQKVRLEPVRPDHWKEILPIAYDRYAAESGAVSLIGGMGKEKFYRDFLSAMKTANGYAAIAGQDMVGYLLGFEGENGYISVPLGGFCVLDCPEKPGIISMLFEKYAGEVCKKGRYHIDICVFAHDETMIRKLSLLQFGIESEKGVFPLENTGLTPSDPRVRKLSKDEKTLNWKPLWRLVSGLLSHLRKSPVFYPCGEFSEAFYREFLCHEQTNVFVAADKERYVGMIETNPESGDFCIGHLKAANAGEIYLKENYRNTGLSCQLLLAAGRYEYDRGSRALWVEHGTANPNAVGFWNRYFDSYCYSMVRDISVPTE